MAVVVGVVFITLGQRRIPTQSAKHVRGRRVYGGTRQYLPLRINQAGVMPIIFASSLLMLPGMFFNLLANMPSGSTAAQWFQHLARCFSRGTSVTYNVLYVRPDLLLLLLLDGHHVQSEGNVGELEGLRYVHSRLSARKTDRRLPGKGHGPDYLRGSRLPGSGGRSCRPIISNSLGVSFAVASFYGGTGLLIAVSVAFDLVQKIDSHLVMRNYRGLLEG